MMKLKYKDLLPYLYIHISRFEDHCWNGEIQNPFIGYKKEFKGILECIKLISAYFDERELALPPASLRTWHSKDGPSEEIFFKLLGSREKSDLIQEEVKKLMEIKFENYEEKLGSTDFLLKICFRQHATWQGELQWIGSESRESKKIFFRSLLELILLIEEALEEEKKIKPSQRLPTWNEDSFRIDQDKSMPKEQLEKNKKEEA